MAANGEARPNIGVVLLDDIGYSDIGCYGGEIHTPHMDRLASGGRANLGYGTERSSYPIATWRVPPGRTRRTMGDGTCAWPRTPFRLFKHWTHEGGIATPFIVSWPARIAGPRIDEYRRLRDMVGIYGDWASRAHVSDWQEIQAKWGQLEYGDP